MKIFSIVIAVLFALFAFFQLNDPDPFVWVSIYLLVAATAGLLASGRFYPVLVLILIGICIDRCMLAWPGVTDYIFNQDGMTIVEGMSYDKPYIEETREFGGALLALLALIYVYVQGKKLSNG